MGKEQSIDVYRVHIVLWYRARYCRLPAMAIKREKGGRWSEVGVPPRSLQEKLIGQL